MRFFGFPGILRLAKPHSLSFFDRLLLEGEDLSIRLRQMLYQRSLNIENRLDSVLQLIRHGEYSTPKLAEKLGVSIPTVSRDVTALRQRGHDIRSKRTDDGWSFVFYQKKPPNAAGEPTSRLKEARV